MNATSILAIGFEQMIVAAVQEGKPRITDPAVAAEATAFLRQEAQHSASHRKHVMALIERYPGLQQVFDSGNALAAREIEHWRCEVSASAIAVTRVPHESDLRPPTLARVPERAERAGQIAHKGIDCGGGLRPLEEDQRLLGPRQHRLGDFFRFVAAAHESFARFPIVLEQPPHGAQPRKDHFVAVLA